jgi:hypothetical protein
MVRVLPEEDEIECLQAYAEVLRTRREERVLTA